MGDLLNKWKACELFIAIKGGKCFVIEINEADQSINVWRSSSSEFKKGKRSAGTGVDYTWSADHWGLVAMIRQKYTYDSNETIRERILKDYTFFGGRKVFEAKAKFDIKTQPAATLRIKEGWLEKEGVKRKKYLKRYFVLSKDGKMSYWTENPDDSTAIKKGEFDVMHEKYSVESILNSKNEIVLTTPKRVWKLRAETESLQDE